MNKTLGQQLKETRESLDLSLDDVASETKIGASTLRCLENDEYSGFDSLTYLKNFLNLYSRYLGLDISGYLKTIHSTEDGCQFLATGKETLPDTKRDKDFKQKEGMPIFLAPVLGLVLLFVCYSLYQLFDSSKEPAEPVVAKPEVKQIEYHYPAPRPEAKQGLFISEFEETIDEEPKVTIAPAP